MSFPDASLDLERLLWEDEADEDDEDEIFVHLCFRLFRHSSKLCLGDFGFGISFLSFIALVFSSVSTIFIPICFCLFSHSSKLSSILGSSVKLDPALVSKEPSAVANLMSFPDASLDLERLRFEDDIFGGLAKRVIHCWMYPFGGVEDLKPRSWRLELKKETWFLLLVDKNIDLKKIYSNKL